MDNSSLLQEGLSLVAFGMGFVFVFLTLLVFATALMSRLVMSFAPAPVEQEKPPRHTPDTDESAERNDEVVAVISAAIKHYRQRHRR